MTKATFKSYTSAPLPFMGQKRRFVASFKEALMLFDKETIFIDLFGGSGLLSHIVKRERPNARVIYNDYDDYSNRLANIGRTNELLADLRTIVANIPREKKLPAHTRAEVMARIEKEEKGGFVDYITLSSSLLFSMNYVNNFEELSKSTLYNCVRKDDYSCDGYLDGLEVVKCDYRELYEQYKGRTDVVFIIDPPYLTTEAGTYKSYWKLADYLDVLRIIKGVSYVYFTSNKSSLIELLDWISRNLHAENPFSGAIQRETQNQMNYQSRYKDIMLYKKVG